MTENTKPAPRFCWECGRKLWANHYAEGMAEGHLRIFHKKCLKERQRGENVNRDWPIHGNPQS